MIFLVVVVKFAALEVDSKCEVFGKKCPLFVCLSVIVNWMNVLVFCGCRVNFECSFGANGVGFYTWKSHYSV